MAKRRKMRKGVFKGFSVILLIGLSALIFWFAHNDFYRVRKTFNSIKSGLKKIDLNFYFDAKKKHEKKIYNACMSEPLKEENFNDATNGKKNEIINYAKNNGLKYKYEDLKTNYAFSYKENDAIYGASLIKLVDALYLIDNNVDLSQKMKYESKYVQGSSEGMKQHSLGSYITLEELMKYAITYSDNTAHAMLFSYIGRDNLKSYANGLGSTVTLTGTGDTFGSQNVHDTAIFLKRAYQVSDTPNGKILKDAMLNTRKNKLNFDDISFAHKYGSWNEYFHNIGIHYGDYPYTISVMTTKGESSAPKYINELSKKTYEFNKLYYENWKSYCEELSKKD